jgi:hypothetical protein
MARRLLAAVLLVGVVAGCSASEGLPTSEPPATTTTTTSTTASTPTTTTDPGTPPGPSIESVGWQVTVYYTAVESFHGDARRGVTGCPKLECQHGNDDLGSYPKSFVKAVEDEGTGRITSGERAGKYLNWSSDTGYWLDTAPRNANGGVLEPFRSAAADGLAQGSKISLVRCGRTSEGTAVVPDVCSKLSAATWSITDAFTPGLGGDLHIDLYVGEETGPGFKENPLYTTLEQAVLRIS